MRKVIVLALILVAGSIAKAQVIDNYGIRLGVGVANQQWKYKSDMFGDLTDWKDNYTGFSVYANVEKQFNKFIALRPEIGYAQKGFNESLQILTDEADPVFSDTKQNLVLHNIVLNLAGKFTPIETTFKPYLLLGLRSDFLIGYNDVQVGQGENSIGIYKEIVDEYKSTLLSGILGLGFDYKELVYIEFEYCPPFSSIYDNSALSISDKFYEFTVGVNINSLFAKQ